MSPEIIDAIRSGADVKVDFETEVIHRPKYTVTRLQDKCPYCGKVAVEKSHVNIDIKADDKPNLRFIKLECGHTLTKEIPKGTPFHKLVSNGWLDSVRSCNHEWDRNQCIKCLEHKLFPFQVDGAKFVESALAVGKGALIADEMGLGKTDQLEALLHYHPEYFPV
jgi:hypothetical protein